MKKILLIIALMFTLTACQSNDNDNIDQTSSATGKWDPSILDNVTEADIQFGNLKKDSNNKNDQIITTVRSNVAKFIIDEFEDVLTNTKSIGDIEYKINKKAMSIIFDKTAQHKFINVGFDYSINLKELEKDYTSEEFINEIKSNDKNVKILETSTMGKILVENLSENSYSAKVRTLYKKDNKSYYIEFSSEVMSIPEVVILAEKFYEGLK